MLALEDIERCYEKIKPYVKETPLEKSLYLSRENQGAYMKLECLQPGVRSFKLRGALGKLLSLTPAQIKNGVATISSGNQGVSLSYACKILNLPSPHIYAPLNTPLPKIHKMKTYNAEIHLVGKDFDEANEIGTREIFQNGYTFVDAREDPEGIFGTASIGIEILKELPDVDAVLIPVGSGGDLVANGSYFKQKKPDVKIYGVEADYSPALLENLTTGKWTRFFPIEKKDPLVQSLTGGCARQTFENAKQICDGILLVSEAEIKEAVYEMAQNEKIIAEPDSAAAYAAYKRYRDRFKDKNAAMIITGGNISSPVFAKIISECSLKDTRE